MTTSGVYRRDRDADLSCDVCDWDGQTLVSEDSEDNYAWWTCPECAHPHQINLTDNRE